MNISKAAQASGISAKMIRYYEEIQLIAPPQRTDSGYRIYHSKDIERLRFIYQSRQLGFSLDHIKVLLQLWQNEHRHSADVKHIAQQHVDELSIKIEHLNTMKLQLEQLIENCAGNQQSDCSILKNIAKKA